MKFKAPNAMSYTDITAPAGDCVQDTSLGIDYRCFADVTTTVNMARGGDYTVANVLGSTGIPDQQAGWALVVVIGDPTLNLRNLTVFDGLVEITNGQAPVTFTVDGFRTPATGDRHTKIGVVATEGDLAFVNDVMLLDGNVVGDGISPENNFFNSTISDLGNPVSSKNPNYVNQLGFDIDRLQVKNLLENNDTSATVRIQTTDDAYAVMVITFATQLFDPRVSATKTVTKGGVDVNDQNVFPGDVLDYTVTVTNSGGDVANDVVLRDLIPASTTYVTGSLAVIDGANSGPKTDELNDDTAFRDTANPNRVVFNVGTGAGLAPPRPMAGHWRRVRARPSDSGSG